VDRRTAPSPSPARCVRAISPPVTPRFRHFLAALFLVFLGWSRQVNRLRFFLVLGGRTLRIIIGLRDYDAISVTRTRHEHCKTTVLATATSTFDAVGELDDQLLRTVCRRGIFTVVDHLSTDKVL